MVRSTKNSQLSKIIKINKEIFSAALFVLLLVQPGLQAETPAQSLEVSIWNANLEDFPKLEREAVRALQHNPGAFEHYLVAALSLQMFKQNPQELRYLKQASDLSQQAIELAPSKEFGYLVAAQVLDLMGYKDDARDMLSNRPSFSQGWRTSFVRGIIAASHEGDKTSFSEFERSLKAPEVSKELVGSYIAFNLEMNYTGKELVERLEVWQKKVNIPAMKYSLARALDEIDQPQRAQLILTELNKTSPSDETKLAEATLLYSKLSRINEAESILLKLNAKSGPTEIKRTAKAHLAKISLMKKDYTLASKLFAEAIEGSPEKIKWLSFAHQAYKDAKMLQEFTFLLTDLSGRIPGNSYLYALQGEVLSENLAQHESAVLSFEAAITLDPKRSEFYNGMGLAYYRMQKHEKALAIFNKAIRIDPRDATARYNEACVLALMGRGEEAVGSLEQAILLDGRLQGVAKTDKDFEGLRSNAQFQSLIQPATVLTKSP